LKPFKPYTRRAAQAAPVAAALALSLSLVTGLASGTQPAGAEDYLDPANPHFQQRWERTDKPVADLDAHRTWMWGPGAFTASIPEPYAESPDGFRQVQYFDKARMEINHPNAHAPNLWYVTTGRLAWELATGNGQIGDNEFEDWEPGAINVAGDPDDADAPTYATLGLVLDVAADDATKILTTLIHRDGTIATDDRYAQHDVSTGMFTNETGHWIADPFWAFMNSDGIVYQDGRLIEDELFVNPFYATGFPITDPYWTTVSLNGEPTDVLVQAFERRVLTYTPSNPDGWKVESGNIGRHYYQWYYGPHPER
jgi:hypothetical protein